MRRPGRGHKRWPRPSTSSTFTEIQAPVREAFAGVRLGGRAPDRLFISVTVDQVGQLQIRGWWEYRV